MLLLKKLKNKYAYIKKLIYMIIIMNYVLEVTTIQPRVFKQTIKYINHLLPQARLEFIKEGIQIKRTIDQENILEIVFIDANTFNCFKIDNLQTNSRVNDLCSAMQVLNQTNVGINVSDLCSALELINDNDPITLYINIHNQSILYVHTDGCDFGIRLLHIEGNSFRLSINTGKNKITMSSNKYHKICTGLSNYGCENVEIMSIGNEISFTGIKNNIFRTYKDTSCTKEKYDTIDTHTCSLHNLLLFKDLNKLSPYINITIGNNHALEISYNIETLGTMTAYLSRASL